MPYHIKEEDKTILGKEMKRLCYLAILKKGFPAYLSLVKLSVEGHKEQKINNRL